MKRWFRVYAVVIGLVTTMFTWVAALGDVSSSSSGGRSWSSGSSGWGGSSSSGGGGHK